MAPNRAIVAARHHSGNDYAARFKTQKPGLTFAAVSVGLASKNSSRQRRSIYLRRADRPISAPTLLGGKLEL